MGSVLWTSEIAPILEPVFFRFFELQVCHAKANVPTGTSMSGVAGRIFFTGSYLGGLFHVFIGKVVPFSLCTNCQHMPALVSVHLIGARDRHLSKLQ